MAEYTRASPYYDTKKFGSFLDVMTSRRVPASVTDTYYEIPSIYNYRPDRLAYELYGNEELWWVFAVRNPNTIKDPIFDFKTGTKIYLPRKDSLEAALGI